MRITQEELRDILLYDGETGNFFWKHSSPSAKAGELAGKIYTNGYRYIAVAGTYYPAALLAWIYVNGVDPDGIIDHIDLDRANDRIDNLRPATNSQNHANRPPPSHNRSGFKGVFWNSQKLKWQAKLMLNGKQKHIGFFSDITDAVLAYRTAAISVWGEFALVPSDTEIAQILRDSSNQFNSQFVNLTPAEMGV